MDMDGKAIVTSVATDIVKSGITLGWEKIKTYFKDLDASADIEYRTAYEDYLKNTKDRYGKIKTIIYRRERKDLYSFYEATGISYAGQTLSSSNINNLLEIDSKILVTGTGGIGKSILFKHLFLNSMEVTNFIPVFIELRSLNTLENKELNISNLIFKTLVSNGFRLERKYFDDSLEQGAYIIFLDGFDEIHHDKKSSITEEIKVFCEMYASNQVFVSSRPSTEFIGWSDFSEFESLPLTKEQALSLINKIDFDETAKSIFSEELEKKLYEKYKSFASNPLLLTIMLLTFQKHASIPERLNDFYEEAFVTLFNVHDATKDSFVRDIRSGLSCEDFKLVFSYICFKSYFKGEYEFSETRLHELINSAKEKFKDKFSFNVDDFQEDLVHSVCMLVKEGLEYRFSHRSFQEYFSAWYTCKLPDTTQEKLLDGWLRESSTIQTDSYFYMLFDLQSEKVNSIILKPVMENIISLYEKEGILSFLKTLFDKFSIKNQEENEQYHSALYIKDMYLCNGLRLLILLNKYQSDRKDFVSKEDYETFNSKIGDGIPYMTIDSGIELFGEEKFANMFSWLSNQVEFINNIYATTKNLKTKKRKVSSIIEEL
ncbi:hypothetical protein RG565_00185 [Streptococcus sp. IsoGale021]|uniref:NACHT domain-containing protein n=2 Tax=Streptococcus TaxID=1301 RepID=UPI0022842879|nr:MULTISPECIES: hypothetical protein [Streptococcus]MCY7209702.1 hypothetical protein [Streptococcus anginosus]MCY7211545.1 hypothetical protein [Streptococcus anginosus]MCY7226672.1 hypothetical protein [Streptococcus anginosus]MDQ8693768.1 hypothetical protein [Streptococcus sp. IsoGale021]MDU5129091.1 hypothetical protein [Streptococcus anginosus]